MIFLKMLAVLVGLVIILFFFLGLKSQKGGAPGLVAGKLAECSSKPNCVSSEPGTQPEKQVAPISASMSLIKSAVIGTGGTITSETDDYISATYMSKIFKFVDDVEVRSEKDGTAHIRSASRVGYSDRGANLKRVDEIKKALK